MKFIGEAQTYTDTSTEMLTKERNENFTRLWPINATSFSVKVQRVIHGNQTRSSLFMALTGIKSYV
jgi:hypothetical protein